MAIDSSRVPPAVAWVRFQEFSGCKIEGASAVPKPSTQRHMDRAYYLTAQLEAPRYGSVQSYDGAGLSAGPLHHIAVYPANQKQGSLFLFLHALSRVTPTPESLFALMLAYRERGWAWTQDGKLREVATRREITGAAILQEFAPNRGAVPRTGALWEKAKRWALLHHYVCADAQLFDAQKQFAIQWLLDGCRATEAAFYARYRKPPEQLEVPEDIGLEEDLALCVYHAYSVNAPGPAREIFVHALSAMQGVPATQPTKQGRVFSRALLTGFSRSEFANWPVRHQRTRAVAQASGLWPAHYFTGVAPIFPAHAKRNALVSQAALDSGCAGDADKPKK